LKLAGVAGTGGEAKVLIQGGAVRVNGNTETRRAHKVGPGDVVAIGREEYRLCTSQK
jgi:ribosome-associated protein